MNIMNTSFKNKLNTLAAREYDRLNVLEEDSHASLCNTTRSPKTNRIIWTLENTEKFYKVNMKKIFISSLYYYI